MSDECKPDCHELHLMLARAYTAEQKLEKAEVKLALAKEALSIMAYDNQYTHHDAEKWSREALAAIEKLGVG